MHSKGTHSLIGAGAIVLGVALGIGVVYWDGANEKTLIVFAETTACPAGNYDCGSCGEETPKGKCLKGCDLCKGLANGKPVCPGKCMGPGVAGCKTIGSCEGKPLEGKPKEMPKEMGGMPPMLPMPMPKMPMPMMPEQPKDCDQNQTRYSTTATTTASTTPQGNAPCPNTPSGVSGMFSNLFGSGNDSSTAGTIKSTFQSVSDKLTSFLWGDTESSATVNTNAGVNNPTEAVVTPAVTGSNVGQITSQTGAQGSSNAGGQGGPPNVAVTGFGSGGANVDTSTGPILAAIKSVATRIQAILSSLF